MSDLQSIFNLMDTHKYRYCQVTASGKGDFGFDWSTGRDGRGDCVSVSMGLTGGVHVSTALHRVDQPLVCEKDLEGRDALYAYLESYLDENRFVPGSSGYPAVVEWFGMMGDTAIPTDFHEKCDCLRKEWWNGVEPTPKVVTCVRLLDFNDAYESAMLSHQLIIPSDDPTPKVPDKHMRGFTVFSTGGVTSYEILYKTYCQEKEELRKAL